MLSGMRKRIDVVRDSSKGCEMRVFAGLELICFPISMFTLLLLPILIINRLWIGFTIPLGVNVSIKILLAAATGYITNFIAVEMLFKPYHKTKKHPLSLMTFGYWSQGLIPRSKSKMGRQLGDGAETLIPPDRIANDLCNMATSLLDDEKNLESIENAVRKFLVSKEEVIVTTCMPVIESACSRKVNDFVTEERIRSLWDDVVKPKLSAEDTKDIVARQFVDYVNSKVPILMPELKEEVRGIIYGFLRRNDWFQSIAAAAVFVGYDDAAKSLSDNIVDEAVDWDEVCKKICGRIGDEQMQGRIKAEVENLISKLEQWLESDNGVCQIRNLVRFSRERINEYIADWLQSDFRKIVGGAIRSEGIWGYVRNKLIPEIRPSLEVWLKGPGKDLVLSKLNLSERIATAVDKLSVEEFHERVNTIAAQHLGAIQVLGYFLGAIVGVGLLVVG